MSFQINLIALYVDTELGFRKY